MLSKSNMNITSKRKIPMEERDLQLLYECAQRSIHHEQSNIILYKRMKIMEIQTKQLKHDMTLLKTSMGEMDTISDTSNIPLQQHINTMETQHETLITHVTTLDNNHKNENHEIFQQLSTLKCQVETLKTTIEKYQQQHATDQQTIQTLDQDILECETQITSLRAQLQEETQELDNVINEKNNIQQTLTQTQTQLQNVRHALIGSHHTMKWNVTAHDKSSQVKISTDGLTASVNYFYPRLITGTKPLTPNTGTYQIHFVLDKFDPTDDGMIIIGLVPSNCKTGDVLFIGWYEEPGWSLTIGNREGYLDVTHNRDPEKMGQVKSGDTVVLTLNTDTGTATFTHNGIQIGNSYNVTETVVVATAMRGDQAIRIDPTPNL